MDIRHIMEYTDTVRDLLKKTLLENSGAFDKPFETIAEFSSIRKLVAHVIGAEERWVVVRLGGGKVPVRYEDRAADTVAGIFEDWDCIRARTHAFVNAIDAAGLAGMVPLSLPQWGLDTSLRVEEYLFHMFNHQTFHLGQISMALQHFGIDPPLFDFVFLRKAPANAAARR
jgi:uncharacterized damage-inducible protein DinB